jgi:hypothetical protein
MIDRAAGFLTACEVCPEDRIRHNGRRAYAWALLRHLFDQTGDERHIGAAEALARRLAPHVRNNPEGAWVIYPGLHERRNYSTNAIDSGIFADAFFDFEKICPAAARMLEDRVDRVVHTYLASKVRTARSIHNQYLWAATGLARWTARHRDHPKSDEYRLLLRQTVAAWLACNAPDGAAPYQSDPASPDLNGITPYYHSRCLAFCWYILDHADIADPDMEARLYRGAVFLSRMRMRSGYKQMLLESKRYYFFGPAEAGSHAFDAYVFYKAFGRRRNAAWPALARQALGALIRAQERNGAIAHGHPGLLRDWQCPTMRTSHLAWAARIPGAFIEAADLDRKDAVPPEDDPGPADGSSTLFQIGGPGGWAHFLTRKPPLTGYSGIRTIGLILPRPFSIHRLRTPYWLHYRTGHNPFFFIRDGSKAVKKTLRHVIWHFFDYLIYKKHPLQALFILKTQCFDFLITGLCRRSTEFCLNLPNLKLHQDSIAYDLLAVDVFGGHGVPVGRRRIRWGPEGLEIEDRLTRRKAWKVRVPARSILNGREIRKDTSLRLNTDVVTCRIPLDEASSRPF